jgi:ferredoxin
MRGACVGPNHVGPHEVEEVCGDGYCRRCHVSLTFEACTSGEWTAEVRRAAGLPTEAPAPAP